MVHFRDTDPRPRDDEEREAGDRYIEAVPIPPGYAELVDRANRRAAELYPLGMIYAEEQEDARRAYVAGYVDAALGGDTIRP